MILKKLSPEFWQRFQNWSIDFLCEGSLFSTHYNPLAGIEACTFLMQEANKGFLGYLLNTTWATCPIAHVRHAIHALTKPDFLYSFYLLLNKFKGELNAEAAIKLIENKLRQDAHINQNTQILHILSECVANIINLQKLTYIDTHTEAHLYQQFAACLGLLDFLGVDLQQSFSFMSDEWAIPVINKHNQAIDWIETFALKYQRVKKSYVPDFPFAFSIINNQTTTK